MKCQRCPKEAELETYIPEDGEKSGIEYLCPDCASYRVETSKGLGVTFEYIQERKENKS